MRFLPWPIDPLFPPTPTQIPQFVDGLMVMTTAQHRVGFLIAEKSYNHPVVGTFAKLAGT